MKLAKEYILRKVGSISSQFHVVGLVPGKETHRALFHETVINDKLLTEVVAYDWLSGNVPLKFYETGPPP